MAVLKFFHVLFLFSWIGTLLMLTRLAGYQANESDEIFQKLSRLFQRIYFFVDFPSMVLAVFFGLLLLFLKNMNWKAPWLHMKLTFAFLLIATDIASGSLIAQRKRYSKVLFLILHALVWVFLILVLIAIYILKQKIEIN